MRFRKNLEISAVIIIKKISRGIQQKIFWREQHIKFHDEIRKELWRGVLIGFTEKNLGKKSEGISETILQGITDKCKENIETVFKEPRKNF